MVSAIRIEHPNVMPVERLRDGDAGEPQQPPLAKLCGVKQHLDCGLPLRRGVFCLGQLGDVGAGVLQGHQLSAVGQDNRISKTTLPGHNSTHRDTRMKHTVGQPVPLSGRIVAH
jgi:hypothetical protein